jgi:hypothetical protein
MIDFLKNKEHFWPIINKKIAFFSQGKLFFLFVLGDAFTLEKIIEIGLDQFSDVIGDISGAASKELAIEQAIADIAHQWKDFKLDVGAYKERGHFRLK